jgi:hypothetical protein
MIKKVIYQLNKSSSMINSSLQNKKLVQRINSMKFIIFTLRMMLKIMHNKKLKNQLMPKSQMKKPLLMPNLLKKNLKPKKPKKPKIPKKLFQLKTKLKRIIKLTEKWPKIIAKLSKTTW